MCLRHSLPFSEFNCSQFDRSAPTIAGLIRQTPGSACRPESSDIEISDHFAAGVSCRGSFALHSVGTCVRCGW